MRDTVVVEFMKGSTLNTSYNLLAIFIITITVGVFLSYMYEKWRDNGKRRNNQR